jgi:hypothetical protein
MISHMRLPNDPRERELLSAKSLNLSAGEFLTLARADQLLTTLDRLELMEKHYLEVAKLDAKEVQRRLGASDPDDLGTLAYKWCLMQVGPKRAEIPLTRRMVSSRLRHPPLSLRYRKSQLGQLTLRMT